MRNFLQGLGQDLCQICCYSSFVNPWASLQSVILARNVAATEMKKEKSLRKESG